MPQRLLAGAGTYRRSLSFDGSTQYLSMSDANFGSYNLSKLTISLWWKLSSNATRHFIAQGTGAASDAFTVLLQSDKIEWNVSDGASYAAGRLVTTSSFTDTTSWHHLLLWWDVANGTANDRMKMWIDGTEITSFGTRVNPSVAMNNSTSAITIGANAAGGQKFAGYIYQPLVVSNVLVPISSLWDGGKPKDARSLSGLYSLLDTNIKDALEDDYVLSTNWTNNGTITKSTIVP